MAGKIKKRLILISVLLSKAFIYSSFGQSEVSSVLIVTDKLMPLEVLIETAILNAPELKTQDEIIKIKKSAYAIQKKDWMKHLVGYGTATYGIGNIMTGVESSGASYYQLTNNQNLYYNIGILVKVPLKNIVTHKEAVNIKEYDINYSLHQRESIERNVKVKVTELYNGILLEEQLLQIRSEAVHSSKTAYDVAEKYFIEGTLSATDLDRVFAMKIRSEEAYAKSKGEMIQLISEMKEIVGDRIFR